MLLALRCFSCCLLDRKGLYSPEMDLRMGIGRVLVRYEADRRPTTGSSDAVVVGRRSQEFARADDYRKGRDPCCHAIEFRFATIVVMDSCRLP